MRGKKTKSGVYKTHLQGQAAVWATASRLALLGYVPLFPGLDHGYDLALENGLRLQVKSARLRIHPGYKLGAYCFELRRFNRMDAKRERNYATDVDFLVLWGVEENRFWIIPATEANVSAIWMPSRTQQERTLKRASQWPVSRLRDHEENWDLLDVNGKVEKTVLDSVQIQAP